MTKPSTINAALGGQLKRELRQQIMKRMVRNLPNLMPFLVGAAVGAVMNRRDTRKLAERVRKDLRKVQVPWDALPSLPPLERPADALSIREIPKELELNPRGRPAGPLRRDLCRRWAAGKVDPRREILRRDTCASRLAGAGAGAGAGRAGSEP